MGRIAGGRNKRKPTAEELSAERTKQEKRDAIKQIPTKAVHVCTCCGSHATISNLEATFFISYSRYHKSTGRIPLCKNCIIEMSTVKGELIIPMFLETIRIIDKPFINSIFESSVMETMGSMDSTGNATFDRDYAFKNKADSIIGKYIKNTSLPQYRGQTWLDGEKEYYPNADGEDWSQTNTLSGSELVLKWGENYTELEYEFLESRYDALVAMANVEYESDAMMLRQICIKELQIRECQKKKQDDTKPIEALQKLMATANIRPTDIKNANSDLLNDSYGKWLNVIEENEPAEYFADVALYDDYDGLKRYFTNWVLRPLKNLLKGTREFTIEED